MNQWAFVAVAYLVTLVALGGLLAWALVTCRRAEDQAEKVTRRP